MVATRIFSVGAALALALPATASPTLARRAFEISEFTPFQKRQETTAAAAETTPAAPAPEPSSPAPEGETTPESQYPVPTVSEAAPVVSESAVASAVPSAVATPSGNNTIPEPTTIEVDGAASLGFMGVAAMLGLAAIAL
ncbi:hypothetical protein VdG1_08693 [Verticillium dahliae VDG1]|nr:hypothetical protein VdG1_08693 [Verticillium dahliae VDG1]